MTSMEEDVLGSALFLPPPGPKKTSSRWSDTKVSMIYLKLPPLAMDPVLLPGRLLTGDADEVGFKARPP